MFSADSIQQIGSRVIGEPVKEPVKEEEETRQPVKRGRPAKKGRT